MASAFALNRVAPAEAGDGAACAPAGLFPHPKAKWRLAAYAALAALDAAAITGNHIVWAAGSRPVDAFAVLQLILSGMLAVRLRAYGLDALRAPHEGGLRLVTAAVAAIIGATALAHLFDRGDAVPPQLSLLTLSLIVLLYALRRVCVILFARGFESGFTNDLVLVDGAPSIDYRGRTVLLAATYGLKPITAPAMLDRIGQCLKHCDRVVIDAPRRRRAAWQEALRGIDVEVELIIDELRAYRPSEMRTLDGNITLLMRRGGLPAGCRLRKRLFDAAVATLAVAVLALPMAVVALAIRLDTPGPVLFRQWRVGRGNRQFQVLKFRTMRTGCSDAAGRRSTARDDARVTRVGRLLRATSLDELPQLFNVLGGSMSIVGPRPHALGSRAGNALFWQVEARYWDRHAVKPGMTGLAQVRGLRGATDTASDLTRRLRADIEYIANWSLMSDLFILLRTVRVLIHRNAF